MRKISVHLHNGFTIIELVVSVAIFAFMTAFLLAKYGNFNENILLTNVAYDVALAVRTAQTYGLNVKSTPNSVTGERFSTQFGFNYGIHFDKSATKLTFFADGDNNNYYTASSADVLIADYTLPNGITISDTVTGDGGTGNSSATPLDITFKRPSPDANILSSRTTVFPYGEIILKKGSLQKKVIVRKTGQISVSD
jgi:prepilin-type N-terminal cleavage/methylation domain-containing protein